MILKVMYLDKSVEDISVARVFTTKYAGGTKESLYYETYADENGKGNLIPMEKIIGWEVVAVIPGSNLKL